MKKSWLRSHRLFLLLGLAILVAVLPIAIQKSNRIARNLNQAAQAVEHVIKWDLNPGSTVVMEASNSQLLSLVHSGSIRGVLKVNRKNPRYFTDAGGKAILLTGSHTWRNLQDSGNSNPPPSFDYPAYLNFLETNNHNFFRLWAWEQPRWALDSPSDNFRFSPMPYQRVGVELAADGLPKFDLTQFNQKYFDRLRERVFEAGKRGMYVSVMLFNGWSIVSDKGIPGGNNPWRSHPFNPANNINGINGDPNGNSSGEEVHQLAVPAITAIQEAYVRKVIDTVNDLDNVLYEISNESDVDSTQWQYHIINFIKSYEAHKSKQHPVGMTAQFPNGDNSILFASPADWVSPNGDVNNRPATDGHKVIMSDTDHLCGVCGDRQWVWKSFTRGENPILMDVYDGAFDLIVENVPPDPLHEASWINLRRNLGYVLTYANRINLATMVPHPELCSSDYCLVSSVNSKGEYLVYTPSGGKVTVDLSNTEGNITGEWFNPQNGLTTADISTTGGARRTFLPPFEGDSILYLKSS